MSTNKKLKKKLKLDLEEILSATEMRELKDQSQLLKPTVVIEGTELTAIAINEVERALSGQELIKIRIASEDSELRAKMVQDICHKTHSVLIQIIGHMVVIYRKTPEETDEE